MIVKLLSIKIIAPSIKIKAMNTPNNLTPKTDFEKNSCLFLALFLLFTLSKTHNILLFDE